VYWAQSGSRTSGPPLPFLLHQAHCVLERLSATHDTPGESIVASETLLAFILTCLVIELTPGPNMAYLAVLSASIGRRAGFAATLGVAIGLLIVGLAAALGLAAVIANSRVLYDALRWAGALYLFWLASEAWRHEEDTLPGTLTVEPSDSKYFLRGLVTNLLNPKAGIFYLAVLPTFVDELRPLLGQTITMSAIYVAVATAIHSAIVLLADTARPWLEDQERSVIIRRVFSLLLVAIAIWLLFATRYNPSPW
jgi:threonine/homoserine/homoserine lactone efflux protein